MQCHVHAFNVLRLPAPVTILLSFRIDTAPLDNNYISYSFPFYFESVFFSFDWHSVGSETKIIIFS